MKLTTMTLFNIAKHTNKTLRLADYLIKSNNELFFNELLKLDDGSSEIDLIYNFNEDLKKTVKEIVDIHSLLSTVDDNGNVLHLDTDNGEKNIKNIFEDNYDIENKILKLPFCNIDLKNDIDKDYLKEKIIEHSLGGLNVNEYDFLFKNRDIIYKHNPEDILSDNEAIEYLSSLEIREQYDDVINKMKHLINKNIEFRKNLSEKDRSLVDDEITFTKAMVESVTKSSLYITKEKGIIQWGSGFKTKYFDDVQELLKAVENSPYIDGVELDKDTDPKAFIRLVKEIESMNFNLNNSSVLKSRKIQNYKANGLFLRNYSIVALDVRSPSAAIHEYIHHVDILNKDIYNSKSRAMFIKYMHGKMFTGMSIEDIDAKFSTKDRKYYEKGVEIIARAGEIAYIFEKYDYVPEKESFDMFKKRVEKEQEITHMYDLNLVSKIKNYIDNKDVYFDIENLDKDEVKYIRDYYKSYYRIDSSLEIEPLEVKEFLPLERKHKVKGKRKFFEPSCLKGIKADNIVNIFEKNELLKKIDPDTIVKELVFNSFYIGKTRKAITESEFEDQENVFKNLCEWAFDNDKYYIMSRLVEHFYNATGYAQHEFLDIIDYLNQDKNNKIEIDYTKGLNNIVSNAKNLVDDYSVFIKKKNINYSEKRQTTDTFIENYNKCLKPIIDSKSVIKNIVKDTESFNDIYDKRKDVLKTDINSRFRINESAKRFSYILSMLDKSIKKDGNKILNYFNKSDLYPMFVLSNDNMSFSSFTYEISKRTKEPMKDLHNPEFILPLLKSTNQLDNLLDKKERLSIKLPTFYLPILHSYITPKDMKIIKNRYDQIEPEKFSKHIKTINIHNVLFNGNPDYDISLPNEKIINEIPSLNNYDKIQEEIKEYKETFSIGFIIKDSLNDNNISLNNNDEIETSIKNTNEVKDEDKKELSSKDNLNNKPIDPNYGPFPKKKGRKKSIDPNQRTLF